MSVWKEIYGKSSYAVGHAKGFAQQRGAGNNGIKVATNDQLTLIR